MPVKMIASRRHYDKVDDKEYAAGESFHVVDDREADRLVKMKRAQRAEKEQTLKAQTIKTRAVTEETPSLAFKEPTSSPSASEQPSSADQRRFYKRRDLTPEV